MTARRLLDVLTEEERELQAHVNALRAEVEELEEKAKAAKAQVTKERAKLKDLKSDAAAARDAVAEATKQALGIKKGDKTNVEEIGRIVDQMRRQWEESQEKTHPSFPPKDTIRWSLDQPQYDWSIVDRFVAEDQQPPGRSHRRRGNAE
jgi:chromosome segregation ATPase